VIDATVGFGGHSKEILKYNVSLLGIDADEESVQVAKENLSGQKAKLVRGNFKDIERIAREKGFSKVDGILFDLGVNFYQLTDQKRGFSFNYPKADLDMRLDRKNQSLTASDLLNGLREDQLVSLFSEVLDLREAKRVSREVTRLRVLKNFKRVGDFLEIFDAPRKSKRIHPSTKAFMALRMAVNSEIDNLKEALLKSVDLLKKGGRLVVISFHSGEDRVIKNFGKEMEEKGVLKVLTNKPISPSEKELKLNPRSRSAKLRAFERI